jgi:cytochrome c556
MMTSNTIRRRRDRCGILVLVAALTLIPGTALPELRPLVPEMLDNLRDVNRIGESIALEDFEQVTASAQALRQRAIGMRELDLATVELDPAQDALWDAFLLAQEASADVVLAAAEQKDSRAVMTAAQRLVGNACLGCHASFRDPGNMLRPSVLFMTSLLSSWREMNRGLAMRDFNLIDLRARDVSALTEVIAGDEILETAFRLGGSKQRRIFRGFLRRVSENAALISQAADAEDLPAVLEASNAMWKDGCISCHEKFRR